MTDNVNTLNAIHSIVTQLQEEIVQLKSEVKNLTQQISNLELQRPSNICSTERMTIKQLSDYLPGNPSVSTIRLWIKEEGLPVDRIKHRLFFRKDKIEEWIETRERKKKLDYEKEMNKFFHLREQKTVAPWRVKETKVKSTI